MVSKYNKLRVFSFSIQVPPPLKVDNSGKGDWSNDGEVGVQTFQETISQEFSLEEYEKLYKVIIHNDHYTAMDFVVRILIDFFDKDFDQAYKIMMHVHRNGKAVAGLYSKEVAETKIAMVKRLAEENEFPLTITLEKVY